MPRRRLRSILCATAAMGLSLAFAPSALAVSDCARQPEVNVLYAGTGVLESVAVDRKGRVFFTDSTNGTLMMIRKTGAAPRVIAEGIDGTGGIVFKRNGKVLVGFGNSIAQAGDGALSPEAGLLQVDPKTKETKVFIEGLQMANGVTRGPGGLIFASSDFGTGIDLIQHRQVQVAWATLVSPNGLITDSTGKYLFANQTFTAAAIQRIPIDDPANLETYYSAGPTDAAAGFDGLTRDGEDRLYVAANNAGQVWRVDGPGDACSLLTRDRFPSGPSDLVFGRGGTVAKSSLLVTTFGGELLELKSTR